MSAIRRSSNRNRRPPGYYAPEGGTRRALFEQQQDPPPPPPPQLQGAHLLEPAQDDLEPDPEEDQEDEAVAILEDNDLLEPAQDDLEPPEPEEDQEQDEAGAILEDNDGHHVPFVQHRLATLILPLAIAIIAVLYVYNTASSTCPLPPCFINSDNDITEPTYKTNHGMCDPSKNRIPCPHGGYCTNGELRSCDPILGLVLYDRSCVLSKLSNDTNAWVFQYLKNRTALHFCNLVGADSTVNDVSKPMFDISDLIGNSQTLLNVLGMSKDFEVVNGTIGLTTERAWNAVPYRCRLRIHVIQATERHEQAIVENIPNQISSALFAFLAKVGKSAVYALKTYPISSIVVIFVMILSIFAFSICIVLQKVGMLKQVEE